MHAFSFLKMTHANKKGPITPSRHEQLSYHHTIFLLFPKSCLQKRPYHVITATTAGYSTSQPLLTITHKLQLEKYYSSIASSPMVELFSTGKT